MKTTGLLLLALGLVLGACDGPGGGGGSSFPLPGTGDGQTTSGDGNVSGDIPFAVSDKGPLVTPDSGTPDDDAPVNVPDTTTDPGKRPPTDTGSDPGNPVCGPNSCGGECGTCPAGYTCSQGQCIQATDDCEKSGISAPIKKATTQPSADKPYFVYEARTSESSPFDVLVLESYQWAPYNGPSAPGTFDLAGSNYEDCGLCVLVYAECQGSSCQKVFFADEGTVEITSMGGAGSNFVGVFHDVKLKEVSIDPNTYKSTPVPNGQTWCMGGYSFSETITEKVLVADCVEQGSGTGIGDQIANFQLQNCNGDWVNLHDKCGKAKALWIEAVAGWCDACKQSVPQVAQAWKDYNSAGLDVMIILGEDQYKQKPTLDYCKAYATSHAADHSIVYIDYGGQYGPWDTLFGYVNPYVGDTIGLPWDAVLRATNMEYVWAATNPGSLDLNGIINQLLSE